MFAGMSGKASETRFVGRNALIPAYTFMTEE